MRCTSFNILHGRSPDDDRVDLDRFADAVRTLETDVLGLQEVDRGQERSGGADLTAVAAEAIGAEHHRFAAALAGTPGGAWAAATGDEQPDAAAYGVALVSRHPVTDWEVVRLPGVRRRVPVHFRGSWRLEWVLDEPRVAVVGVVQTPSGPLTVANTHLSFLPGWNVVQLRRLLRALARRPRPLLLMGDLNLDPPAVRRASALRPLVAAPTFPAHAPVRQLDHLLLDEPGPPRPVSGAAVRLPLSDHRALQVDL